MLEARSAAKVVSGKKDKWLLCEKGDKRAVLRVHRKPRKETSQLSHFLDYSKASHLSKHTSAQVRINEENDRWTGFTVFHFDNPEEAEGVFHALNADRPRVRELFSPPRIVPKLGQ